MIKNIRSWWLKNFTTTTICDIILTLKTGHVIRIRNVQSFSISTESNTVATFKWKQWDFETEKFIYIDPLTISSIRRTNTHT